MTTQSQIKHLNVQYQKLKDDARKLMLRGDLNRYFKKLLQITDVEHHYRQLVGKQLMRAAA